MRALFTALSIIIGIIGLVFILQGAYHPLKVSKGLIRKCERSPSHTSLYGGNTYYSSRRRYC